MTIVPVTSADLEWQQEDLSEVEAVIETLQEEISADLPFTSLPIEE